MITSVPAISYRIQFCPAKELPKTQADPPTVPTTLFRERNLTFGLVGFRVWTVEL